MKNIQDIITEIKTIYQEVAPIELELNKKVPNKIEEITAFENDNFILPDDYKYFLTNTDFNIQIVGNFTTLSFKEAIDKLKMMNDLLDNNTFEGWVEEMQIEEIYYGIKEEIIKKCWWNKKWIPFAEDGCGNLKCIDLDPANNGVRGQIISMEFQGDIGPSVTKFKSFTEYIEMHLVALLNNEYDLDNEGLLLMH